MSGNVVIKIGVKPHQESLVLDGEDISGAVRGFQLEHQAGKRPQLALDLGVFEIDVDADNTRLHLTDRAHFLLLRFGWTPPPKDGTE